MTTPPLRVHGRTGKAGRTIRGVDARATHGDGDARVAPMTATVMTVPARGIHG